MPFLYLYHSDDFVEGKSPPEEAGTAADGSPPFKLQLKTDATPTLIELTDDEAVFDEVDSNQVLTNAVSLNGVTYDAGTTVYSSYDLINSDNNHKVTGVHFGGDGFDQGPVQGLISTIELEPGTDYTFDTERTSHEEDNQYSQYFACFLRGTLIDTDTDDKSVEALQTGDLVRTVDGQFRPLRLKLQQKICGEELSRNPQRYPIRIGQGSLGPHLSKRDLWVSRQHRMLVRSKIVERMFGTTEALIPAIKLIELPGIFVDGEIDEVEYFHLLFDQHEVIYAEGTPSESFFTSSEALKSISPEARLEIFSIFPEIANLDYTARPARLIPTGQTQKQLIKRHLKNSKPCISLNHAPQARPV